VFVTPLEVFSLVDRLHSAKLNIGPVLLAQVGAVSMIFLAVPLVIVAAVGS